MKKKEGHKTGSVNHTKKQPAYSRQYHHIFSLSIVDEKGSKEEVWKFRRLKDGSFKITRYYPKGGYIGKL